MLNYKIIYTNKSSKIKVNHNSTILISVPKGTKKYRIDALINKNYKWITKKQDLNRKIDFNKDRTIFYLGKKYKIIVSDKTKIDKSFYINKNHKKIIREKSCYILTEYFNKVYEKLNFKIKKPELKIRIMKSRWGSCCRSGKIILNLNLIKASPDCIKYIILHELCHLKIFNHSKDFWKLVKSHDTNYLKKKNKLDKNIFGKDIL